MTNIVFAVDNSGSTDRRIPYWNRVQELLDVVLSRSKDIQCTPTFVLWNCTPTVVSLPQLLLTITNRTGKSGTLLSNVAKLLIETPLSQSSILYICTDGCISATEVADTDKLLQEHTFGEVHLFIEARYAASNLSIAAPFTRKSIYTVYTNGEIALQGSTSNPLELPTITTFDEFTAAGDSLWAIQYTHGSVETFTMTRMHFN